MKIMFCLGSMTKGGAERVVANLSSYLSDKGDKVSIVVTPSSKSSYKLNKNVDFYTLDNKDNPKKNIIYRNINRIHKLKKIIKKIDPDIIIAMLPEPSFRVLIANLFNRRKIILSVRNDPKIEYNNIFKKLLLKTIYKRSNGFVFQTEDAKKFFDRNIQNKSVIIPNPIGENFITYKEYDGVRKKTIITVGRFVPQKNHKLLIEAFAEIVKEFKDYKLIMYGDGELKNEYIDLVKKLNIQKSVDFAGEVDKIEDKIHDSSIFILSSDYEGMPNALMEAMALGLPCISTNCPCGGPAFLIEDNINGLLFDVGDKNGLVNKIKYLLNNKEISNNMSREARKIKQILSPSKINEEWLCYINKIKEGGYSEY